MNITSGVSVSPAEIRVRQDSGKLKPDSVYSTVVSIKPGSMKDTIISTLKIPAQKDFIPKTGNKPVTDSVAQTVVKQKPIQATNNSSVELSVFKVAARPDYSAKDQIAINPEVPYGLMYRIQIGIFRNLVTPAYFKGITPVYGVKAEGSDKTTYFAGMFRKSVDAGKALIAVKGKGFKDAFVVPVLDNKPVSADRAKILEKEWGGKPLFVRAETIRDTVPPTLVYRVEVVKSTKPLNKELLENIKKLAAARGLDILTNESGQNVYVIGKFLTFESASEYADLLLRNGYREAIVVAYLGKREILVETARKLFENIK